MRSSRKKELNTSTKIAAEWEVGLTELLDEPHRYHSEACREARRETDAEHRRVSSGGYCKRVGCIREAQEERELGLYEADAFE